MPIQRELFPPSTAPPRPDVWVGWIRAKGQELWCRTVEADSFDAAWTALLEVKVSGDFRVLPDGQEPGRVA